MGVYTTPARPGTSYQPQWTRMTHNAIDSRTYRTEGPRDINSPDFGWKVVLNPCWRKGLTDEGFRFYAFVKKDVALPSVIRLGKKGCPVRLLWRKISTTKAAQIGRRMQPTHAVNPLDVQGQIVSYEPVSIPPHLVFRTAEIADDWFVIDGKDVIHVPRRFTPAGPVIISPAENVPRTRRRKSA
jgi:CRISPR-associated protein Csc1